MGGGIRVFTMSPDCGGGLARFPQVRVIGGNCPVFVTKKQVFTVFRKTHVDGVMGRSYIESASFHVRPV